MYQKHNLVGKGPICDMLASNYDLNMIVINQEQKRLVGVREKSNLDKLMSEED